MNSNNNYNNNINENIKDPYTALELLKRNLLISKSYPSKISLYAWMTDSNILVISKDSKYYINKYQFIEDFYLSKFYVYKDLNEVDIDMEFRKLRQ